MTVGILGKTQQTESKFPSGGKERHTEREKEDEARGRPVERELKGTHSVSCSASKCFTYK